MNYLPALHRYEEQCTTEKTTTTTTTQLKSVNKLKFLEAFWVQRLTNFRSGGWLQIGI